ncbi:cytochrome c-type biogenesis protein CcmH [Paracoccus halophilus]|uniref:Cytochrome C biogenesis protein n=1 Tax=Paracoccus halophilus TaxID=376733 RepID=A0A099F000_9RHOB|nr:c-type cytochrome biogenesis protein CcmI [Paracoccus halophilus]KGJ03819.1 cytochrome C biogenesis protein [Paracoccus halophilus]SFA56997.1 cytochrome c-type biogenesis protein CcmH [Paracoccus halophilus]
MFWIISAALVAIVAIAIAAPLLRQRDATAEPTAAYDLRVYRDQMREIERDLERGLIGQADAERLRVEIGRKVLAADRALQRETAARRTPGGMVAVVVLAVLVGGALLLYREIGAPGRPDAPIVQRIADARAFYDQRPSQAEAEKNAPRPEAPELDPAYAELIERLREAVAANPDDPRGLELLAEHESRLGNAAAAKEAQARLVALRGDKAGAADWARLAALTIEAAGGLITAEGENAIARALRTDPAYPQARFMAGLLQVQSGRPDLAFPIWAQLLAESPEDAPWTAPIRASIGDLAWFAGQPDYVPPALSSAPQTPAMPGPDAEAVAAAEEMTPDERQQMIEGMVKGLETRLTSQGGTAQEWARLIGALPVIGQTDHARMILAEARSRFAQDAPALEIIAAAAQQAGLE